ncbi:MAG: GNAT family N-acetyltransferase [Bacteroidales bacterium]
MGKTGCCDGCADHRMQDRITTGRKGKFERSMRKCLGFQKNDVRIRALEPEDLGSFLRWENDTEIWGFGSQIQPLSQFLVREYLNQSLNADVMSMKQVRFVIEYKGEVAGCIDYFDYDPLNRRASMGILIDQGFRNKGVASHAIALLMEYGYNYLNLHQIYVHIPSDNLPSIKLFESLNFQFTGELKDWVYRSGAYHHVKLFQYIFK